MEAKSSRKAILEALEIDLESQDSDFGGQESDFGGQKRKKIMANCQEPRKFFHMGHLGRVLESLEDVLGPSWGVLGVSWEGFGRSWGLPGTILEAFLEDFRAS